MLFPSFLSRTNVSQREEHIEEIYLIHRQEIYLMPVGGSDDTADDGADDGELANRHEEIETREVRSYRYPAMIVGVSILLHCVFRGEALRYYRQIGTGLSNSMQSLYSQEVRVPILCGVVTGVCTGIWSSKPGFWGGHSKRELVLE
jgi:hypothetical protein